MDKMKADINEISGNTAEVTLDGDGWHCVVTASIALESYGGLFEEVLDAWIVWQNDENIPFPKDALAMPEVEVAINKALVKWYEDEDENQAINDALGDTRSEGWGDYLLHCRHEERED